MKKTLLFKTLPAILLASAVATAPTFAAPSSTSSSASTTQRIGVLNVNSIITSSTAAKEVSKQMDGLRKAAQDKIYNRESKLRDEEKKLMDQQKTLSQAEFDKRKKAFDTKVAELQKEIMIQNNDLQRAAQGAMEQIRTGVVEVATAVAKERGFDLILPSSFPVYFDDTLDVTTEIVARLNKKIPTMKVATERSKTTSKKTAKS
ncbi:MAG: OmpH family outer membrane protein [Alphaproteobacteria bacterium]